MTFLPQQLARPRRLRCQGLRLWIRSLAVATIAAVATPRLAASDEEQNHCGCYRDGSGSCLCSKKATCGCPGECEPRGCEEKREKELQKEIQAETKKAEESSRGRSATPDQESDAETTPAKPKPAPTHQKISPAQARQLAKLLELYLSGHPGDGGKSVEELRRDLSSPR